jgi:glycosyltransferase involved in cell wall biosynthesis
MNSLNETAKTSRILALIPAYNEAASIATVVNGARVHLPVWVVDDGSQDDTTTCAEQAGATVLRQVPNQGKGTALRAGFRRALEEGYEAVVTLDADGQHDPAEIPHFTNAYSARRPDLLIGARDFLQMPLSRRLANTIGRWTFSWALRQPVRDNQSGYRLISHRLLPALLSSNEQGFEFEVEMIVTCVQHGFALDWIPIRTIYVDQSSHIDPWHHTVNFFRLVWQTRQRTKKSNPRRGDVP